MSIVQQIMKAVVQVLPDKQPDRLIQQRNYVGQPISRVDGRVKVSGEALFSAEYQLDNLCYAALAYSTIARGRIRQLHVAAAQAADGVLAVITHENCPRFQDPLEFDPTGDVRGSAATSLPPLGDNQIHWNGQPIAVVLAATQEQAEAAAVLVRADYDEAAAHLSFEQEKAAAKVPDEVLGEPAELKIGDAERELAAAPYRVDHRYHTPRYNHNAIEPHATIAAFNDDGTLLIYDATQHMYGVKSTIAKQAGLPPDQVRVVAPFVGGGFGGKGSTWFNTMLAVMAAKFVGRPVKLNLSREGVFRLVGGRTLSEQRVALGAAKDGQLLAVIHSGTTATTRDHAFPEQFSFPARHLYGARSFFIQQQVVYLDMVANTFMRAPGESIGTFALESAMDELAHELDLDPIELRLRNEPGKDPTSGHAFSARHLVEAYRQGAARWGWQPRPPRSQPDGEWLVGQGVASAIFPFNRRPASVKLAVYADDTAVLKAAAHDMGMGTATVQLQHTADRLGLPLEAVSFHYGDTILPMAALAGASSQTASVAAAIAAAADKLLQELLDLAKQQDASPLQGLSADEVELKAGGLVSKQDAAKGASYGDILRGAEKGFLEVEAAADKPTEAMKYSIHSYGAQFCEVRVNEVTGEIRVSRWLGVFDTGRVFNAKTGTSQFRGGIIFGIGMALLEETFFDERTGRIMNPSLAEYHVPVQADVPDIDIIFLDLPDEHTPLGGHGLGEIGVTGAAAAIANAVFNATGKRIRSLPITLDKLL